MTERRTATSPRTLIILFLLLVIAALAGGCQEPNPVDPNGATEFSARIDGAAWGAGVIDAVRVTPPGVLTIACTAGGRAINLSLTVNGKGTLDLAGPLHSARVDKDGITYSTVNGGSGTLRVTGFDERQRLITGSFSFVAKDNAGRSVVVDNGSFANVRWTEG